MRTLLESLSKEQIIDFLAEHARLDTDLANKLHVQFGKIEFSKELNKMKRKLAIAFDDVNDSYHRDGWGFLRIDTYSIDNEIDERIKQGHFRLAFAESSLLYEKYLEIFEYQEECEISDAAENTLVKMADIAKRVDPGEDGDYIFKTCLALCKIESGKNYGADYEDRLLRIASYFVTKENAAELMATVEHYSGGWRTETAKLIQLEIIEKVKGQEAAEAFINDNMQYDNIREIAYEKAMAQNDYALAEKLCIGGVAGNESQAYSRHLSPWLYKLYFVYETTKNMAKMSETAEKILLHGDLKYYDILKSLLKKQNLWEERYGKLREDCEKALYYKYYAKLLAKEKEYTLLFALAKKYTDLVYEYGKPLCKCARQETFDIFINDIKQEAGRAKNRKAYQAVCRLISIFRSAGYAAEADELIADLKLTYKNRPAFVDELTLCAF